MKWITTIEDAMAFMQEEMVKIRLQLAEELPRPQKFNPYPSLAILTSPLSTILNSGERVASTWGTAEKIAMGTREEVEARQQSLCNYIRSKLAEAEVIRQSNAGVGEHNTEVKRQVIMMMNAMGIPDTHYQNVTKGRKTVSQKVSAGYVTDLIRHVPSQDGFAAHEAALKRKMEEINRWATDQLIKITKAEQEAREAEEARQRLNFIATMRVRYELDFDADIDQVRQAFFARNRYVEMMDRVHKRQFGPAKAALGNNPQGTDLELCQAVDDLNFYDDDSRAELMERIIMEASRIDNTTLMDYDRFNALQLDRIGIG